MIETEAVVFRLAINANPSKACVTDEISLAAYRFKSFRAPIVALNTDWKWVVLLLLPLVETVRAK